jgi:hypothetical protein
MRFDFARIGILQPKLKVSQANDAYEQEADTVADRVMRMSLSDLAISATIPVNHKRIDATREGCEMKNEEEGKLNISREASSISDLGATGEITNEINNVRSSGGSSLDTSAKEFMESRFGYDFGNVRIHAGNLAARSAESLNALAYTVGNHIVFGEGQYQPNSLEGKKLLGHELAHFVQQNGNTESQNDFIVPGKHVAISETIQRQPKEDSARHDYPWIGRIDNTWSAALRKSPKKSADAPHANTLADLPRGTELTVVHRENGWLIVKVTIDGKPVQGFVSQELVTYVRPSAFKVPEIIIEVKFPSLAEAFVELKKAEKRKAREGSAFNPTEEDQSRIDRAIIVINATKKYVVDESTYIVTFARKAGVKTEIDTIEDFILFVEQVEKQYPKASPKEIASEVRQLWFSDVNWEILLASEGIYEGRGKDVDIETEPNPIASQFNMLTLAPGAGSKQFDTRMGKVDIGHVMAGIDARLSGFPSSYPLAHLVKRGHSDRDAVLKYDTLKEATGGDSIDFVTWSGDLGQAYAEYLVDRYVKGNTAASLSKFATDKAPQEELLGDIHGYIAVEVHRTSASLSPTGTEQKVSNVLRDLYLVEKSATGGNTYKKYFERVSGRSSVDLKTFVTERSLRFAKPWFAKKAVEHRGKWKSKGWTAAGILENAMKEFDNKHVINEKSAAPADKIETLVDNLLKNIAAPIK